MCAQPQLDDVGIPVRSVNRAQLYAGRNRDGTSCLYATMSQQADNFFVLRIDPETGAFQQFTAAVPESNYTTAVFMSPRSGRLYIGAAHSGQLYCFDPQTADLVDLGTINEGAAIFPCRIDEDSEGRIWIGSYGSADLTCYDPATGAFTRCGRMDDEDMYCYPLVNADDTVACLITQTRPHVVVWDPSTRTRTVVGPVTTKGEDTLNLHRGDDGRLYIESSAGHFRIEGTEAIPVDAVAPPAPPETTLPDGSSFCFADAAEHVNRTLEIRRPDGAVHTFELDYEASGTDIFSLHAGPDECLYGSSVLPEHLFRHNPNDGELIDLGVCSVSAGEAYSMANLDGKMYISSYPAARLSVYDPSQGYRFGEESGANPQDLGPMDDLSYRPRSTLAGPLGRVWTASLPDYGRWGGPLSWYDPQTGEKKAYYQIAGDASCYVLAHLPGEDLIAVGTSVSGGSGTIPKVDQAVLFLWDYQAESKTWEGTLDRTVRCFNALVAGPDGRLYGTVHGGDAPAEVFVFESTPRTFGERVALPPGRPLDLGLQHGPDGMLYGFTTSCIYRLNPASMTIDEVIRAEDAFTVPGPIIGNTIFFATGHRLRAAKVF